MLRPAAVVVAESPPLAVDFARRSSFWRELYSSPLHRRIRGSSIGGDTGVGHHFSRRCFCSKCHCRRCRLPSNRGNIGISTVSDWSHASYWSHSNSTSYWSRSSSRFCNLFSHRILFKSACIASFSLCASPIQLSKPQHPRPIEEYYYSLPQPLNAVPAIYSFAVPVPDGHRTSYTITRSSRPLLATDVQ